MAKQFPPRGYQRDEFPLPHDVEYKFSLMAEDETKNSTICTLFRFVEAAYQPENQFVNPSNAGFGEDAGVTCSPHSIIPKVNFRMTAAMTKLAIETDKMRNIRFMWFPIYTSFLDSLEAMDDKTDTQIEDILKLTHTPGNKNVYPTYSTVKLDGGSNHPLSTVNDDDEAYAAFGLTASAVLESVAFDDNVFWDAMQYYTNRGMLASVVGKIRQPIVSRDRPYVYSSNNFTNPSVKRMNPYTFCGVMIHLFQASSKNQVFNSGDTTNTLAHLDFKISLRFPEWNQEYNQTPY